MKNYLVLLLLLAGILPATGQILNPDFGLYSSCPDSWSEIFKCSNWRQPGLGTSDYFNSCYSGPNISVGVPQNIMGYQSSGSNAYAGICAYSRAGEYKEYISTSFSPLTVGKTYKMTIKVSLADSSMYAIDGLGVYFSTYELHDSTYHTLPVIPQVKYSNYGIVTDMINWVTLSKFFLADSAYTNLTIGAFGSFDTLMVFPGGKKNLCYYYIGHVQLDTAIILPAADSSNPDTPKYTFPNAFTPNKDAVNDIFRIIGSPDAIFGDFSLHIFNRWGARVFITNNPIIGWDGTFNNTPQEIGIYYYLADFTINGKHERIKGDVTLIR